MLHIAALAFERDTRTLFTNLSCTVRAGELLHVRGENGSGKSTLLRLLAGLLRPACGTITWQGETMTAQSAHLQYVGHQNGLKPYLTAAENLLLAAALRGLTLSSDHVFTILDSVTLRAFATTQVRYFSAGQARRLALARLLLTPTRLWILDEPMTALDTSGQAWLHAVLHQHLQQNGCVVLASHQELPLPGTVQHLLLGETHA